MTTAPVVFVSHASEDKERFVLPFATKLRQQGVDAWVDRWEMVAGDSLVQKVFVTGLDAADAVIVVLSPASIHRPWVREELDSAVVKHINEGSRLIPLILDDLSLDDIPAPVRHLLHVRVPDPGDVEHAAAEVLRALFNETDRPPVGTRPKYAYSHAPAIGTLDRIDSLILKEIGERAVRDWTTEFLTAELEDEVTSTVGCTAGEWLDSLEVLDGDRLIKIHLKVGPRPQNMPTFGLTDHGLRTFARTCVSGYPAMERRVLLSLANWPDRGGTVGEVSEHAECPGLLAEKILEGLARRRLVILTPATAGGRDRRHWSNPSPKIRRMTRSGL